MSVTGGRPDAASVAVDMVVRLSDMLSAVSNGCDAASIGNGGGAQTGENGPEGSNDFLVLTLESRGQPGGAVESLGLDVLDQHHSSSISMLPASLLGGAAEPLMNADDMLAFGSSSNGIGGGGLPFDDNLLDQQMHHPHLLRQQSAPPRMNNHPIVTSAPADPSWANPTMESVPEGGLPPPPHPLQQQQQLQHQQLQQEEIKLELKHEAIITPLVLTDIDGCSPADSLWIDHDLATNDHRQQFNLPPQQHQLPQQHQQQQVGGAGGATLSHLNTHTPGGSRIPAGPLANSSGRRRNSFDVHDLLDSHTLTPSVRSGAADSSLQHQQHHHHRTALSAPASPTHSLLAAAGANSSSSSLHLHPLPSDADHHIMAFSAPSSPGASHQPNNHHPHQMQHIQQHQHMLDAAATAAVVAGLDAQEFKPEPYFGDALSMAGGLAQPPHYDAAPMHQQPMLMGYMAPDEHSLNINPGLVDDVTVQAPMHLDQHRYHQQHFPHQLPQHQQHQHHQQQQHQQQQQNYHYHHQPAYGSPVASSMPPPLPSTGLQPQKKRGRKKRRASLPVDIARPRPARAAACRAVDTLKAVAGELNKRPSSRYRDSDDENDQNYYATPTTASYTTSYTVPVTTSRQRAAAAAAAAAATHTATTASSHYDDDADLNDNNNDDDDDDDDYVDGSSNYNPRRRSTTTRRAAAGAAAAVAAAVGASSPATYLGGTGYDAAEFYPEHPRPRDGSAFHQHHHQQQHYGDDLYSHTPMVPSADSSPSTFNGSPAKPTYLPRQRSNSNGPATRATNHMKRTSSDMVSTPRKKSRMPISDSSARATHNQLERQRRTTLRNRIDILRGEVPSIMGNHKAGTIHILRVSADYIRSLTSGNNRNREERQRLIERNEALARKIRAAGRQPGAPNSGASSYGSPENSSTSSLVA